MADGDNNPADNPAAPGADPEATLKAMLKFIHGPAADAIGVPTDKFIIACQQLQKVSATAAAQGNNAAAAEAMAIVNREIRIRLRFEMPADEAEALNALADSAMEAEGAYLNPGIQETIAALSDEEFERRRAANPSYSDADTEKRLLAILDEYFYHALKKGTLLTDWPAKLEEISSFDPDLAVQASAQFFNDPQASLRTVEEFSHITAAAEQACATASAKGYHANAARTMADILLQVRKNIQALAGNEDMVAALRPVGNDAVGKFNSIMVAWATVAFAHPNDTRPPEAIKTAETALRTFVLRLSAQGFNMGGGQPPALGVS